jgi:hypothetical protein
MLCFRRSRDAEHQDRHNDAIVPAFASKKRKNHGDLGLEVSPKTAG